MFGITVRFSLFGFDFSFIFKIYNLLSQFRCFNIVLWSIFFGDIIFELFAFIPFVHKINMLQTHNTYVWVPPIKQQDGGPYTGPLLNFTTIAHCCEILFLTQSEDRCSHRYTVSQYHLSLSTEKGIFIGYFFRFFFSLYDWTREKCWRKIVCI